MASLCLAAGLVSADGNRYPLVLVHGFTGWGPEEMGGYHYWGGTDNIAAMLNDAGYETGVAAVGPLSSNWDRACELYAYIRGGRVDYGKAHSSRFGHARFGRTYQGRLRDWGQTVEHASVHLVGHSQGGQTVRVLASLLAEGDPAERAAATAEEPVHPLFAGGRASWVHSISTLASPHNGTTLANVLDSGSDYLLNWLLAIASHLTLRGYAAPPYDFKLDQWAISRKPGESDRQYRHRLSSSGIWRQPDIALHDLKPEGAAELNRRYPAVHSVYHFSWAAQGNKPGHSGKSFQPALGMNLALVAPSLAISRYVQADPPPGLPEFDDVWWPNDGVVNTVSMSGPRLGSGDRIVTVVKPAETQQWQPGVWHFMGVKQGWDHLDLVGQQTRHDYQRFYLALGRLLHGLPAATAPGTKAIGEPAPH